MRKHIRNFINGMAFGVTQVVPGVSGGTIAIIMGFYDKLIKSINNFRKDKRESLRFLIPLALGAIAGILAAAFLISDLLDAHSFPTMLFFIGLIVGIIPLIYKKIKQPGKPFKLKEILLILIPIILLVTVATVFRNDCDYCNGGMNTSEVMRDSYCDCEINAGEVMSEMGVPYMLFIFFIGMIAAASLVIPGISGSFVLLITGIYPLAVYSVSALRTYLSDVSNTGLLFDICKVLIPLGLGIVIGGLLTVRLIERLLEKYHNVVYSVILGLIIGSVYALFRDPVVFQSYRGVEIAPWVYAVGAVTFLLGCAASFFIGKKRL